MPPRFAEQESKLAATTKPPRTMSDAPLTSTLAGDIVQIRLPMAGNPLRYVNGYLLEDDDGHTLVDCGWKADDVFAALQQGLAEHGRSLADVRRLLVTHMHFDHYGLAGTLLRAGVPVLGMHQADWEAAREYLTDPAASDAAADAWIARNGFSLGGAGISDEDEHQRRTELTRPTHLVADGERIGRLQALWTPGHSPGHLCFLDTISGALLTGDHVLNPITPHVGIWFPGRGDLLGKYIASLQRAAATGATRALPAHGEPFDHLHQRVDELLAHEASRESGVLAALAHGAVSATDVARSLRWRRRGDAFDDLNEWHRQFAVAETLAHLEHLRAAGAVERDDATTPVRYMLRAAA
jgi:glyoxylase-like metal-dependent hydrolase (beta-lactamase superfamily II)